jgi:thiamine biosynthesis lipoprotein
MKQFIYRFEAMSTSCEITLFSHDKQIADSCAQAVLKEIKRLEKKYNYYDSNSYLSQLNQRKSDKIDQETKFLLQTSKLYYKETNKIFDITIATAKELYKLDKLDEFEKRFNKLKDYIGCEHFSIKKNKLSFDNEFTKIDLGGVVKEYAVDRSVTVIKKYKILSALVNLGGDIYAIGKKPDGEKFKIGIKNPKNKDENIHYQEIENEALTTSASYERNTQIQNKFFSHIISKEKKYADILSATVISNNTLKSGVYSTALMIDDKLSKEVNSLIITSNLEIRYK